MECHRVRHAADVFLLAQIMIKDGKVHVIRKRQAVEAIWANEVALP